VPRIRRPLLALIVLVVALAIGYGVNALRAHGAPALRKAPTSSTAASTPTGSAGWSGATAAMPADASADRARVAAAG
jgi:hypothetical protein